MLDHASRTGATFGEKFATSSVMLTLSCSILHNTFAGLLLPNFRTIQLI